MADKDLDNDEYKFSEADFQDSDPLLDKSSGEDMSSKYGIPVANTNVRRNAFIAVGLLIFLILMYSLFSSRKTKPTPLPAVPVAQVTAPAVQPEPTSIPAPAPVPVQEVDSDLKQKVATIETNQQNVTTQVSSMSQQLSTMSTSVSSLNDEINKLNQVINALSSQMAKQSQEIRIMMLRSKRSAQVLPERQRIRYYIKAIIPGRAWLIGSNGSTLSIREGIQLNGYGVVKLIDSLQGRVLTSSGKVIRFSQDDS